MKNKDLTIDEDFDYADEVWESMHFDFSDMDKEIKTTGDEICGAVAIDDSEIAAMMAEQNAKLDIKGVMSLVSCIRTLNTKEKSAFMDNDIISQLPKERKEVYFYAMQAYLEGYEAALEEIQRRFAGDIISFVKRKTE